MTGTVLYALPVLRGILAIAPLPGTGGDYAADLAHLKDWRPAAVMSLAGADEMAKVGGAGLPGDVVHLGARWLHMPVPDFGVPDASAAAQWRAATATALPALRGGGRVMIHCKGGCGRSGMAALRLMIAAGEAPEAALARLRALRPCAVETKAQMRWAMQGGAA